jgi:hypothetical protein
MFEGRRKKEEGRRKKGEGRGERRRAGSGLLMVEVDRLLLNLLVGDRLNYL